MNSRVVAYFFYLFILLVNSSFIQAVGRTARGREELYQLADNNPQEVESLTISDCWSSRDLEYYDEYSDADFEFLTDSFPNLKSLRIEQITQLTGNALKYLINIPHLKSLSISGYQQLTDEGLKNLIVAAPQLKELTIESITGENTIRGKSLGDILNQTQIESLVISNLHLPDENWAKIFTQASELKNLSISWDNSLSSEALITMTGAAPNLESFTIRGVFLGERSVDHMTWETFFASFPKLAHVSFGYHVDKTGSIFVGLQNGKPDLLSLCLENLREGPRHQMSFEWPMTNFTFFPYPKGLKHLIFEDGSINLDYGNRCGLGNLLESLEVLTFSGTWLNYLDPRVFSRGFSKLKEIHVNGGREMVEGEKSREVKRHNPQLKIFRNGTMI